MLSLALASTWDVASAQPASPIAITSGFNGQFIASGSGPAAASTTATIDGTSVFYDSSYDVSHGNNGGTFPAGSTVTGQDGNTYALGAVGSNNGLNIDSLNSSASVTFNPTTAGTLYLLGLSASPTPGLSVIDYTLHFNLGPSASGSFSFSDWYDPTGSETVTGFGRISQSTDSYDFTSGGSPILKLFGLSAVAIPIPLADQSSTLDSADFTYDAINSQSGSSATIFAASSTTAITTVPEPSTIALIGTATGLAFLVIRRRN